MRRSVPTSKVHHSVNLEGVLGESLQHYGIKRNVPFTNRTGTTMNVNFEVIDTNRAILPMYQMEEVKLLMTRVVLNGSNRS